ncbi:NUDIX hydrolase [Dolichospermum sp. ST_sed3]|nr:NUDIX hydrolase [Dolichospermum sp. ST_sed3]
MNRFDLVHSLNDYQTPFQEEKDFLKRFLSLLGDQPCFERTHLPGHITGSAWIVDFNRTKVLLVHHAKLNKWVQPGGHADGDEDILRVALKEAEEETGLKEFKIVDPKKPFDVDIHLIPKRPEFPEHFHYDVRFLLEANPNDLIQVSEESHAVKWIRLADLEQFSQERSVLRMKEKLF